MLVDALGLSFALGAFLAGVVVAESTHGRAAAGRIVPLRDVFAAMFFVFIGTLFDPAIVVRAPVALLALLVGAILGKGIISVLVVRLFRSPAPTAIMSGLLLAQIGEFAFILAGIGLDRGGYFSVALLSNHRSGCPEHFPQFAPGGFSPSGTRLHSYYDWLASFQDATKIESPQALRVSLSAVLLLQDALQHLAQGIAG